MIDPKLEIAKKIASMMSKDQKRQAIQKFYDEHKNDAEFENNLQQLRNMLDCQDQDIPKR